MDRRLTHCGARPPDGELIGPQARTMIEYRVRLACLAERTPQTVSAQNYERTTVMSFELMPGRRHKSLPGLAFHDCVLPKDGQNLVKASSMKEAFVLEGRVFRAAHFGFQVGNALSLEPWDVLVLGFAQCNIIGPWSTPHWTWGQRV